VGGNVWKWAADPLGDERITMGGSWWYEPQQMRADVQAWKPTGFYAVCLGFRYVYER
jgi:formylglycine-generating enzyme required for sulfatase activity